jgi:methionyl-tRNA formyltransferase
LEIVLKIAYFGYDFFVDCLEMILSNGHTVSALYTFECDNDNYNFNTRIQELGRQHNIPITFHRPDDSLLHELESQGVELIISAGYPHKLPVSDTIRGINIHPTLLPRGRSAWPLPWTILLGDKHSGVSIHKLTHHWDAGDVLQQTPFNVIDNETLESLSCKSAVAAVECLKSVLSEFDDVWNSAAPQENEQTSYWGMPTDQDRTINLDAEVDVIDRVVRAFGNFESFITFNNQKWLVQGATIWKESHNHKPGTVLTHNNKSALFAAKDGYVCLTHFRANPNFDEKLV